MPDGELAVGDWGEGFVDRRHPHTYFHELMLSGHDLLGPADGPLRVSVSAGKGFAPFGTDDPMSRPVLRYPVNHHLSQILERAVVLAGVRWGHVVLEGGLFNGDEPASPSQWPNLERFGDSWSVRLSVEPLQGLELQGSRAEVLSAEHRPGEGPEEIKWSSSARWSRPIGRVPVYGLVEWAESSEADRFFVFHSFLAEGAIETGRHRPYYRFERTERPEELRLLNLFRTQRPSLENSILGISRWTLHTLGYRFHISGRSGRLELQPFGEVSYGRVSKVGAGVFDPEGLYGRTHFWSATVGMRLGWDMAGHRMGRYGSLGRGTSQATEHVH